VVRLLEPAMTLARAIACLIFGVVLAMTAWASQPGRRAELQPPPDAPVPLRLFEALVDRPAQFILPPGGGDVLLSLRAWTAEDPLAPDPIVILRAELEWFQPDGSRVRGRQLVSRSRRTRGSSAGAGERSLAGLVGEDGFVSDPRSFVVPGGELLPGGGHLSVRPVEGSPALLVRAWELGQRSPTDVARVALAPGSRLASRMARATGLGAWTMLRPEERMAAAQWTSRSLPPAAPRGISPPGHLFTAGGGRVPFAHRELDELVLAPGRSVAVNVVGPCELRLAGTAGLGALQISTVSPRSGAGTPSRVAPGEPLGWLEPAEGLAVVVGEDGPVSVVLSNPSSSLIGPFRAVLPSAVPEAIHPGTPATWLHGLEPDALAPGEGRALIGPERRILGAVRLGPDGSAPLWIEVPSSLERRIELTVRAVLAGLEDRAPRSVSVRALDPGGVTLWSGELALVPEPAPFESLDDDPSSWISEPQSITVGLPPGAARVEVASLLDTLVSAAVEGATVPAADDEGALADLRYDAENERRWVPLAPQNRAELQAASQLVRIRANTRFELRPEPGEPSPYATVEPPPSLGEAGVWMVPLDPGSWADAAWCSFASGEQQLFRWRGDPATPESSLEGRIWTASEDLGRAWDVRLDGAPWRHGVATQRVTRIGALREPGHARVDFAAPPGSRLWLKLADAVGPPCEAPHRAQRAWSLAPGATFDVLVPRTDRAALLSVGGFAESDATLEIEIEDRRQRGGSLSLARWTDTLRRITLPASGEPVVRLLSDPTPRRRVLESRAVRLGDDLPPGPIRVRVRNLGPQPVELRLAVESSASSAPSAPEARRVRTGVTP
jgi:hypothetical protein